jgi:hypothetical protein
VTNSIDPGQHIWWLASRSMGVVAMLLVSMSLAFGLAMSGRLVRGPGVNARLKTVHEQEEQPGGTRVGARAERVRDPEQVDGERQAVQLAPGRDADQPAHVEAQRDDRGEPARDDPGRGPQRARGQRERDGDSGHAGVEERIGEQEQSVEDDRQQAAERQRLGISALPIVVAGLPRALGSRRPLVVTSR